MEGRPGDRAGVGRQRRRAARAGRFDRCTSFKAPFLNPFPTPKGPLAPIPERVIMEQAFGCWGENPDPV